MVPVLAKLLLLDPAETEELRRSVLWRSHGVTSKCRKWIKTIHASFQSDNVPFPFLSSATIMSSFPPNYYFYIKSRKNGQVLDVYNGETSVCERSMTHHPLTNCTSLEAWYTSDYLAPGKGNAYNSCGVHQNKLETSVEIQWQREPSKVLTLCLNITSGWFFRHLEHL